MKMRRLYKKAVYKEECLSICVFVAPILTEFSMMREDLPGEVLEGENCV
jgi:hypothetical protein